MPFVMKSIENSCEILSLMSCKMSLNCTEMGNINDIINNINDEIALLEVKMYKPYDDFVQCVAFRE